jgi:hypothetical protein
MTFFAIDAPGDFDFALARQQRHRAHLAQVHADRIVGLVERAGSEVQLDFFRTLTGPIDRLFVARVLLIRVDDLDAGAAEGVEKVVQFFRRGDLGGQELVHLVVEKVPLLFADADELPDFIVFFFERERFSLIGVHDVSSSMRWAKVRF